MGQQSLYLTVKIDVSMKTMPKHAPLTDIPKRETVVSEACVLTNSLHGDYDHFMIDFAVAMDLGLLT